VKAAAAARSGTRGVGIGEHQQKVNMHKCQYQVFVEITGKGEEGMSTPEATSPAYRACELE
jgi:hypothetical protein